MKLLIKYATRGRQGLFYETINNILSLTKGDYILVVSADEDDPRMNNEEVRLFCQQRNVPIIYGWSKNKVHAINRDLEKYEHWDWLVNMSDDMKFLYEGWDLKMIEHIKGHWGDSTDFFAHFNDGYTHERLTTLSVIGREYFERFGYIYHPAYGSFSCDAEAMYVAQMLGKYHYFPELYYKHYHPANTPMIQTDEMYQRAGAWSNKDITVYFERMKKLFYVNNPVMIPGDVDKTLKEKFNIIYERKTCDTYTHN